MKNGLSKGIYFYGYLSLTVIPMSISITYLLKLCNRPIWNTQFTKHLSAITFGVYLIHPFMQEVVNKAGYGPMTYFPLVSVPLSAIVVFMLSSIAIWIISQIPYVKKII
jgi:surface polysaccharide O-acyltransferase-like enzyme